MDRKVCKHCGLTKELLLFPKDKALKDGYKNHCKACNAKISEAYRKRHPDRVSEAKKIRSQKQETKEKQKLYNSSDRGKAAQKRYLSSEKGKEYYYQYSQLPKSKERSKRYRTSERGKEVAIKGTKKWIKKNEVKKVAHGKLNYAILMGRVTKQPCTVCGSDKSHGHHEDYSKALEVVWYCVKHHAQRHRQLRKMGAVWDSQGKIIFPRKDGSDANEGT